MLNVKCYIYYITYRNYNIIYTYIHVYIYIYIIHIQCVMYYIFFNNINYEKLCMLTCHNVVLEVFRASGFYGWVLHWAFRSLGFRAAKAFLALEGLG